MSKGTKIRTGFFESHFTNGFGHVMVNDQSVPQEIRLGRVAAYFFRCRAQGMQGRFEVYGGKGSRRSIFDATLTLDEILLAILHPESPLSMAERVKALKALIESDSNCKSFELQPLDDDEEDY